MSGSFNPYQEWFGIPLDDQPPNHYRILGLELFEDSQSKIEDAVAAQVEFLQALSLGEHVVHAQQILSEVAKARLCLVSPERKQEYDNQLRNPVTSAKPIPLAIPIDANLALEDLKLALEDRKSKSGRRQPDSKVRKSRPTRRNRKTWLTIPIGAAVCLVAVLIGVFWWNAPSKQQLSTENQIPNEGELETVASAVRKELEVGEHLTSPAKTRDKPKEKPSATDVAGAITLRARDAKRNGIMAYEFDEAKGFDNLGKWQSPHAYGQWDFHVKKPGTFTVELVYASPENPGYRIIMGSATLEGDLENTRAWNSWTPVHVGKLKITDAGKHTIQMYRKSGGSYGRINVRAIRLIPAGK